MSLFRTHLLHGCTALFLFAQTAWSQANGTAKDTLNQSDVYGRKQGWWQVTAPKPEKPQYNAGQLIEEGRYTDSKRIGRWKRYWPNGKVMSEVNYDLGRPKGEYRIYYPSGKLEEHGTWDVDRNTGTFKRWHPNGQLSQDFVFDQYGTRNGMQKYYHENGQVEVEVNIKGGKEDGTLKRYYANGDVQQVAQFNNGVINEANSKYVRSVSKPAPEPVDATAKPAPARNAEDVTNAVVFRENGYNTLYDKQLRITQQGEFKNGQLWNGKVYRYDASGLLYRIEVYASGRFAGNGVISDEDKR
ncbi:MAG TPA: toxin-antitoxin system YwqK family antitoxin [Flavobacteriales bacterium]